MALNPNTTTNTKANRPPAPHMDGNGNNHQGSITDETTSMSPSLIEYQRMLTVQKEFFATNATKPIEWRLEQLDRLRAMLSENHQRFLDAVGKDFKSSVYEQYFEVDAVIGTIDATKTQLADW